MTGSIASARTRQIDRATLALNRDAPAALHRQLEAGLRSAIAEGRLQPGAPLPGTRTLAEELGVARITVATAYEQLVAEGYLDASARSGTRVARDLPATGFRLGDAHGAVHDAVSDLGGIYPAPNPGIPLAPVTMDDGLPDDEIDLGPESFSLASVDRRADAVMSRCGAEGLSPGGTVAIGLL